MNTLQTFDLYISKKVKDMSFELYYVEMYNWSGFHDNEINGFVAAKLTDLFFCLFRA